MQKIIDIYIQGEWEDYKNKNKFQNYLHRNNANMQRITIVCIQLTLSFLLFVLKF